MSSPVRVRFAPSPTGLLHIGGARTALFNFLFARNQGGKFLLRIEDTDRERSEDRFTADILASLKWLGLNWDEEPIYQSHRFDRYKGIADDLLAKGIAYRCVCTPAELDAVRAQCQKEKRPFRYPGTCRNKKLSEPKGVIRINVTNEGETAYNDLIRDTITFQNKDIDDWVVARSDGSPTYNFSVVIDDHDQGITHVLRGDDHINNTPKQILLYRTLGWTPPEFGHFPMILGTDRAKLSKRHGAGSTLDYRQMGYLPAAVVNFLVRLGWSHGDQELFTLKEMCEHFSLRNVGKSGAIFNIEKLDWMSGHYLKTSSAADLLSYLKLYFSNEIAFAASVDKARLESGISIIQAKVKNLLELIEQLKCLFGPDPQYVVDNIAPDERTKMAGFLSKILAALSASDFTKADLETRVRAVATELGEKLGPLGQAIRFAMTGGKVSPGLFEMLEVQGKETVLRRLAEAQRKLA